MFDKISVKDLPEDNFDAGKVICDILFAEHRNYPNDTIRLRNFYQYIKALAFAESFIENRGIEIPLPELEYEKGQTVENLNMILGLFIRWREKIDPVLKRRKFMQDYEEAKKLYASKFGKGFFYEFTESDFEKVQVLVNELRDLITKSEDFEPGHKRRLLRRLEKLQAELHKKMSNLDMLWGLIGDAGVVLGKFGEDSKPFVDRIGEILQIVCRIQAKAENVQKFLPLNLLTDGKSKSDIQAP